MESLKDAYFGRRTLLKYLHFTINFRLSIFKMYSFNKTDDLCKPVLRKILLFLSFFDEYILEMKMNTKLSAAYAKA